MISVDHHHDKMDTYMIRSILHDKIESYMMSVDTKL